MNKTKQARHAEKCWGKLMSLFAENGGKMKSLDEAKLSAIITETEEFYSNQ